MSQWELKPSRRVAVYCDEPDGRLVACMLALQARGDRILTAMDGYSGRRAGLLHLISRMAEGEFDAVVAFPAPPRLDLTKVSG